MERKINNVLKLTLEQREKLAKDDNSRYFLRGKLLFVGLSTEERAMVLVINPI